MEANEANDDDDEWQTLYNAATNSRSRASTTREKLAIQDEACSEAATSLLLFVIEPGEWFSHFSKPIKILWRRF